MQFMAYSPKIITVIFIGVLPFPLPHRAHCCPRALSFMKPTRWPYFDTFTTLSTTEEA